MPDSKPFRHSSLEANTLSTDDTDYLLVGTEKEEIADFCEAVNAAVPENIT